MSHRSVNPAHRKAWQSALGVYWKGDEANDQNVGRGLSLGHLQESVLKVRLEASKQIHGTHSSTPKPLAGDSVILSCSQIARLS